jgi:cytochrome c551/c552
MKKLAILLVLLAVVTGVVYAQAPAADSRLSYVGPEFTGDNTPRLTPDTKLGFHDVMQSPVGENTNNAVQRNGCQGCHIPHFALQSEEGTYLWSHNLPTNIVGQDGNNIQLDAASFHTLACLSCHDGVTARDVINNFSYTDSAGQHSGMPEYVLVNSDTAGLMNDHPVNVVLTQHGTTAPPRQYVRFYTPAGYTAPEGTTSFGYVECGSCHDPHKGDSQTYMFLRGPKPGTTATDAAGNTYTGTGPQWARLGLCRDCHGK